ncbi:MAG: DUF2339 domain-containing protein, partial [Lentisphaeria bacterium]
MNDIKQKLNFSKTLQKHLDDLVLLQNKIKDFEQSDLVVKNSQLLNEINTSRHELNEAIKQINNLQKENNNLKATVFKQVYSDKMRILSNSNKKIENFFHSDVEGEYNKLIAREQRIKTRLSNIKNDLIKHNLDFSDNILTKIEQIEQEVHQKISHLKQDITINQGAFNQFDKSEFHNLKEEPIDPAIINSTINSNNFESFIGNNVINKVAILLIIIGMVAGTKFTYDKVNVYIRSIMMFALGLSLLTSGELMNKKKTSNFSMGLTAGGVAMLYTAVSLCHLKLHTIEMIPALIICLLISITTTVLSLRYKSQTISIFTTLGGYIPLIIIKPNEFTHSMLIYFLVINTMVLIITSLKKWHLTAFSGLIFNLIGSIFIVNSVNYDQLNYAFCLAYLLLSFFSYTAIPLVANYKNKLNFSKIDISFLAINTVVSSIVIYTFMNFAKLKQYNGLLAIILATVYLLIGMLSNKKLVTAKKVIFIFYSTSFTFVVLTIPLLFNKEWFTLGWLVIGVLITCYGILKNERGMLIKGFITIFLCIASFIFIDWYENCFHFGDILIWKHTQELFAYKYFAITFGLICILIAYIKRQTLSTTFQVYFKCFTLLNLANYLFYLSFRFVALLATQWESKINYTNFLSIILGSILCMLLATWLIQSKLLANTSTKITAILIQLFGILFLVFATTLIPVFTNNQIFVHKAIATIIIILSNLISIYSMLIILRSIQKRVLFNHELISVLITIYLLSMLTITLISQYMLSFTSMIISIIYVVLAFLGITFGFTKQNA